MEKEKEDLIKLILGITKKSERFSTLQLALERARYFCGNEGGSEKYSEAKFAFRQNNLDKLLEGDFPKRNEEIGDIFVSILLYLNSLEQLGNLFYSRENTKNGITDTLNHASRIGIVDFSDGEMPNAIKRLRHALAHNYSLVSMPNSHSKDKIYYKYTFSYENRKDKILEMPKTNWNGNYKDKKEDSSVIVYVIPLINKIEEIIEKSKDEFQNGLLSCKMPLEKIRTKFTII